MNDESQKDNGSISAIIAMLLRLIVVIIIDEGKSRR